MKVVSDVLHLSYLDKFGLRVTVEAGQAYPYRIFITNRGVINTSVWMSVQDMTLFIIFAI